MADARFQVLFRQVFQVGINIIRPAKPAWDGRNGRAGVGLGGEEGG